MRVALFVEASDPPAGSAPSLLEVWQGICADLGVLDPAQVYPISKGHLVAMDPGKTKMPGRSEGLDDLLKRMHSRDDFDAAVVLWDLQPAWSHEQGACRWEETQALYRHMASRARLPEPFLSWVKQRSQDLAQRAQPSARSSAPIPSRGAILPVCMEPEFEGWLLQDESALKQVLGVSGQQLRGWPPDLSLRRGGQKAKNLLASAIVAAQSLKPLPEACRKIRGDWRTNQPGWTLYLCRALARHDPVTWRNHPIADRLRELLSQRPDAPGRSTKGRSRAR